MNQRIELRRMRDFNDKMNITFEFMRLHFTPLFKSLSLIGGPFMIISGVVSGYYNKYYLALQKDGLSGGPLAMISELGTWVGLMFLFFAISYAVILIVVYEYFRLYGKQAIPHVIGVNDIWPVVKKNFISLIAVSILVAVVITAGFLFLILPGIYLMIVFSLIVPIMIIEQKSIGESFSRCFTLISGKWWSTFGLVVITSIIVAVMSQIFAIPQYIFTFVQAAHDVAEDGSLPLWQELGLIISSVIATFGSSLLQTITLVAVGFQYYNLVERKEAAGLMAKLDSFGQSKTPVAGQDANDSF